MSSLPQERHSLDLRQILAGVGTLAQKELPRLLGQLREVEAAAMAGLYAQSSNSAATEQEQLIDVEAAKRLNVSEDYLYRNWKKFPFARKYDWGLRFQRAGSENHPAEDRRGVPQLFGRWHLRR